MTTISYETHPREVELARLFPSLSETYFDRILGKVVGTKIFKTYGAFIDLDMFNSKWDQTLATITYEEMLSGLNLPVSSGRPGRNDQCWCDSGKKYKKCCLNSGNN
jgi:SEC-C motif